MSPDEHTSREAPGEEPREAPRGKPGEAPREKPRAARSLDQPHPSRLRPDDPDHDEILAAHRAAMAVGASGYLDPRTGLYVLTSVFLAERGTCCDGGCRHCPYLD
jgi:hypothetical protein